MLTKAPKGTKDVLPGQSYKWQYIEELIRNFTKSFGYQEIRTPVFEHTELFERGVGDTTDIVQKEMYTFLDKGQRSITLKPEGTAGAVRSYIEHKLYAEPQPVKMYYITSCYRYEKPQAGRLREFHQFGLEVFGANEASVDAEIIVMAMSLFRYLGINNLSVNINSIGCPKCRPNYHMILMNYFNEHKQTLCSTCNERLGKNPLRVLDCKVDKCREVIINAPTIIDFLCEECGSHFNALKQFLDSGKVKYNIDPMIVRGLDYYTKTVFEIISNDIGSQGTVCGGGRYDELVKECGGPPVAGVGFGMGLERLFMILENQNISIPNPQNFDVYFINVGERAKIPIFNILNKLRNRGIKAEMNHVGRSTKAQFKYSDKINVPWVCIIGDDEINNSSAKVRNMKTGIEEDVPLDALEEYFYTKIKEEM